MEPTNIIRKKIFNQPRNFNKLGRYCRYRGSFIGDSSISFKIVFVVKKVIKGLKSLFVEKFRKT